MSPLDASVAPPPSSPRRRLRRIFSVPESPAPASAAAPPPAEELLSVTRALGSEGTARLLMAQRNSVLRSYCRSFGAVPVDGPLVGLAARGGDWAALGSRLELVDALLAQLWDLWQQDHTPKTPVGRARCVVAAAALVEVSGEKRLREKEEEEEEPAENSEDDCASGSSSSWSPRRAKKKLKRGARKNGANGRSANGHGSPAKAASHLATAEGAPWPGKEGGLDVGANGGANGGAGADLQQLPSIREFVTKYLHRRGRE